MKTKGGNTIYRKQDRKDRINCRFFLRFMIQPFFGLPIGEKSCSLHLNQVKTSNQKEVDKNDVYYDSQGNYVVDGVKYYNATPNLDGYTEQYKLYRDMLSTKGPSGRSLAEEWFRLGVWISKQQSWTSAPYEPLQKAATGYGYKLLIPDYKMNYYSGDHKFDVYTSGLKPASSMKDAETKMRDYAYMTYAKFGGDKFTWEKSELSNDDRKQDILYMIVRATTNTGTWSSSNTVDLPPYTRVLLKTNTATETFHESWKAPMYLTYKVTLVDYSIDLEDNAKKHDHAQVITSFPNGRNGEPGDAVSAVKYCIDNRADFNDVNWNEIIRKSNSFEYHGVKGSIEPVINILNENISDAPHMENLTSTQKVINQSSGGLISLYPMKKIDIKKGSTEYTLTKGDFMYPSEIELEGRLDSEHQNAPLSGL